MSKVWYQNIVQVGSDLFLGTKVRFPHFKSNRFLIWISPQHLFHFFEPSWERSETGRNKILHPATWIHKVNTSLPLSLQKWFPSKLSSVCEPLPWVPMPALSVFLTIDDRAGAEHSLWQKSITTGCPACLCQSLSFPSRQVAISDHWIEKRSRHRGGSVSKASTP